MDKCIEITFIFNYMHRIMFKKCFNNIFILYKFTNYTT